MDQLELVVAAQQHVLQARRDVTENERLLGKRLITWPTLVGVINERDAAEAALDGLLTAVVAHRETWCHDSSECPLCLRERQP